MEVGAEDRQHTGTRERGWNVGRSGQREGPSDGACILRSQLPLGIPYPPPAGQSAYLFAVVGGGARVVLFADRHGRLVVWLRVQELVRTAVATQLQRRPRAPNPR